jgi:hypothetical protein
MSAHIVQRNFRVCQTRKIMKEGTNQRGNKISQKYIITIFIIDLSSANIAMLVIIENTNSPSIFKHAL